MSSPITLYIVPNTGIEIELEGDHVKRFAKKSVLPTNISTRNSSPRARKSVSYYTIHASQLRNYLKEGVPLEKVYSGAYSPLSDVTLPSAIRKKLGIPESASYYTYIHPPNDLARDLDKEKVKDPPMKVDMENVNDFASPFIATLGGYVYLDKDLQIVSVNALSLHRSKYEVRLIGPFPTDPTFSESILKSHRAKPFVLDCFFEVGYVASAWIRPKEKFHTKVATDKHDYGNGCFLFFKDDGSSCVYSIDATGYIDPNGDTSPLADAFRVESQVFDRVKKKSSYVLNHVFLSEEEKLADRKLIRRIQDVWELNQYIDHNMQGERRGLLHTAVKNGCTKDDIAKILEIAPREEENLLHKDEVIGFTPLHCACRHQPKNTELIQYLIDKNPKAVTMRDQFDRMPLHIACDVGISHKVIKTLIDADVQKKSIKTATKLNGRLPIHIACFNKEIEKESIKLLCDADPSNDTLLKSSLDGRLPLHCAVSQKMDVGIIKILLGLNETHSNEAIEVVTASAHRARNALYETYLGMLPLHLAVWKNCPVDTIEVLLEADTLEETVIETVGLQSHLVRDMNLLDEDERESRDKILIGCCLEKIFHRNQSQRQLDMAATTTSYYDESTYNKNYDDSIADTLESGRSSEIEVQLSSSNDDAKEVNVTALHLAAQNGNGDVILKLLQKETDIRQGDNTLKYGVECIKLQDKDGRTPLHLYITNEGMSKHTKPDPTIVYALLEMDYNGETTHIADEDGYFPLHCAVDRDDSNVTIVESLLVAEEHYRVNLAKNSIFTEEKVKRSTHTCDNRKRSPLYLAVKAGASEQVIEKLLAPEHFYLKGFDSNLVTGISSMAVKNTSIQNLIIEKLSERCYFSLLFMDVYANATALSVFLVGSQRFVEGTMTIQAPIVLLSCVGVFILREFIQLKSQSSTYFADAWNWMNVSSITALALSSKHMFENQGKALADFDIDKRLLTVTGALLITQFTFFLRSTFLPFARFVGGTCGYFNERSISGCLSN